MKIRTKISLVFLILTLLIITNFLILIFVQNRISRYLQGINFSSTQLRSLEEVYVNSNSMMKEFMDIMLLEESERSEFNSYRVKVETALNTLMNTTTGELEYFGADNDTEEYQIISVQHALSLIHSHITDLIYETLAKDTTILSKSELMEIMDQTNELLEKELLPKIRTQVQNELDEIGSIQKRIAFLSKSASIIRYILMILSILTIAGAAIYLIRTISKPLAEIVDYTENIGKGDFSGTVKTISNDEIGVLANSINKMVGELETYVEKEKGSAASLAQREELQGNLQFLQKALQDKDFLMKELNHRVKNNLMLITSLIRMKSVSLGNDIDLSDIIHQVQAISIVHEKLYMEGDVTSVDMLQYIPDLLTSLLSFCKQPVSVKTEITVRRLNISMVIPLGLIINEIATNAIKHGFTGKGPHTFSLTFHPAQDRKLLLVISNTGSPIPENISLENPATLGLRLIHSLTGQLNGTISMERTPHPTFSISIPEDEQ